jgi:hypothetical protein
LVHLKPLLSWFVVSLVILGSVRGALVINLDYKYDIVYPFASGALLMLALLGAIYSLKYRLKEILLFKYILLINVILFVIHIIIYLNFRSYEQNIIKSFIFFFIPPYIIFILLLLDAKHVEKIILIITLLIAYSVINNFVEMLKPSGTDFLNNYRRLLRGSNIEMSYSGIMYGSMIKRIGGYTGSMHDSGNILGLTSVYYLVSFFVKKAYSNLWLFIISFMGLMMTQSLTNILVTLITITIFYLYIILSKPKIYLIMFGLFMTVLVITIYFTSYEFFQVLFARSTEGSRSGMYANLGFDEIFSSIPIILSGHAIELDSPQIGVEIGLLKIIYQLGILHSLVLFFILLFPLYLFVKYYNYSKYNVLLLPTLAANIFGFMSMLHYSSLVRSTSIFLYFSISSLFIIIFYKHKNHNKFIMIKSKN